MAKVLPGTAALVVAVMAGGTMGIAGPAKADHAHSSLLCRRFQHIITKGPGSSRYIVRNDDYGRADRECIRNFRRLPNFRVVRSSARGGHIQPVAYPNIFIGCSGRLCTRGSGFPRRASLVRSLVTSWSVGTHAQGVWGAGLDLWFARRRGLSGQQGGAEIMLWINARGFGANLWPVVAVGHTHWHLAQWVTTHHGDTWQYVQFRRVGLTSAIRRLDLAPFIEAAEQRGMISPRWWLTGVEAGFEIWRGGVGLSTTRFSARIDGIIARQHRHSR
jgi:hypothetical protein